MSDFGGVLSFVYLVLQINGHPLPFSLPLQICFSILHGAIGGAAQRHAQKVSRSRCVHEKYFICARDNKF